MFVSGLSNSQQLATPVSCTGLLRSVTGGCDAYYSHVGDGDGTYERCHNPGGSGSNCAVLTTFAQLRCNTCPGTVGRRNLRTAGHGSWCSDLATSVSGGCESWYEHAGTGNGAYTFCRNPSSGSNCEQRRNATELTCNACEGVPGRRNARQQSTQHVVNHLGPHTRSRSLRWNAGYWRAATR